MKPYIIITILVTAITFLAVAFFNLNFNPIYWGFGGRLSCILGSALFSFIACCFYGFINNYSEALKDFEK